MNDAKSMLIMYSYAATKAAEDKEDTTKAKTETTTTETKTKVVQADKDNKQTKRRGKKNDQ